MSAGERLRAEANLRSVDAKIRSLEAIRRTLSHLIEEARTGGSRQCTLFSPRSTPMTFTWRKQMADVEIVYDRDCPNLEETRKAVRQALTSLGISPTWREWESSSPDTPEHLRGYGSPTVLVDGKDVAGSPAPAGRCCRLYEEDTGELSGVPPVSRIVDALGRRERT